MDITLSKARLYMLVAAVVAVLLGAGIGFHLYDEAKKKEQARQQELQRIASAVNAYVSLMGNIEEKIAFSIVDYYKVDDELSHLNLLGWKPVEFLCQSISCQYTLETDNKHYVGVPKLSVEYSGDNVVLSENSLIMNDIKLSSIKHSVNEAFYEALPQCTHVLTDLRKFIDIASFALTNGSGNATFSFLQPSELVRNKNLLTKGRSEPFLDIYGIDWSAEKLNKVQLNYISGYISSRQNVGVSAIRKMYGSNGSIDSSYNVTGSVYCKVN